MLLKITDIINEELPMLPKSIISLAVLNHFSEMLCFNRVKIHTLNIEIYPNLYSIVFSDSGTGKDNLLRIIKNLTEFEIIQAKEIKSWHNIQIKTLDEEIQELINKGELNKKQVNQYRKENDPKWITTDADNGTVEGMLSMRERLEEARFGYLNFSHSEFGKFISNKNNTSEQLITYLLQAYEGNTKAKIIKSSIHCKAVTNVPQTMFAHSALSGLIDNNKATKELKSFLETGLARRCFLCFPDKKDFGQPVDLSENFAEFNAELTKEKETLKTFIKEKYQLIKIDFSNINYAKEITITTNAFKIYLKYKFECEKKSLLINNELSGEQFSRHWKTLKLAGVLCFLERDNLEVDEEIMQTAIKLADEYAKEMGKFFTAINNDEINNLYNFIKNNPNCTKTDIRHAVLDSGQKLLKEIKNTKHLDELLSIVEQDCSNRGEIFKMEILPRNKTIFSITEHPKHLDLLQKTRVKISVGKNNETFNTDFSDIREIDFNSLHEVITGNKAYSSTIFKDGVRKGENWEGCNNLIILDIDNDNKELTIENAKEKFKEFKFLLVTTKSHQKVKNDRKVDRFRIIFPTGKMSFKDKETYSNIYKNIETEFSLEGSLDLKACKDVARIYQAHKGEYYYNEGNKLLNWEVFNYTTKENTQSFSTVKFKNDNNMNTRPHQIFRDGKTWDNFRHIKNGETVPLLCTDHNDKNPSAFIGKSDKNGHLFFKCSACDAFYFEK